MTEHRPLYHAYSGRVGPASPNPTSASQPLIQYYTDGTVASDTVLLLPILLSPMHHKQPSSCMQLVHLGNSALSFCNARTDETCACCMTPVCVSHSRRAMVVFSDETDQGTREAILCETCLVLPVHMRHALHAFVVAINSPERATNETTHRPVTVPQAATPICQRRDCPWNASRRVTIETTQEVAFPTSLNGLIFPSRRTTFDLCSGCYHFNIKRDKAFQIIDIAPLSWPEVQP